MKINNREIEINVGEYLRYKGYSDIPDYGRVNSPFRTNSDSESFCVDGEVYYDHVTGEGGNIWNIALELNSDSKIDAMRDLCEFCNEPFNESNGKKDYHGILYANIWEDILSKIKNRFGWDSIPDEPKNYLIYRGVRNKTQHYFAYIPKGELKKIITEDEISKWGLGKIEEKIIFFYYKGDNPVYFCTRGIETKEFRKAFIPKDKGVHHPIWNMDDLYTKEKVIWGEGMFDCTSLIEMGYGVAGEITCNLIDAHKIPLLKALRWRETNHPEWSFTICLDNDKPDSMGIRRGNESAKKIALWLLDEGVNVKWVCWTDGETKKETKIDINDIYTDGGISLDSLKNRLDEADYVSDLIGADFETSLKYYLNSLALGFNKSANHILKSALVKAKENNDLPCKTLLNQLIKKNKVQWRKIWGKEIQSIFVDNKKYYVFYKDGYFPSYVKENYRVFDGLNSLIENLKDVQRNQNFDPKAVEIIIPSKTLTWQVTKETSKEKELQPCFNMFVPSKYLLSKGNPDINEVPVMWDFVLDNLAGKEEKEWLLDHMATYVQTLKKPFTIPVFEGNQGTGKTILMQLFGKGIGSFVAIGNREIESSFNSYMMKAVVLFDEVSNSNRDSTRLKNMLKSLVNTEQQINMKYIPEFTISSNNYISMAYNPQDFQNSISIEEGDRRYSIITGGVNENLSHNDKFSYDDLENSLGEFMDYLKNREVINKNCFSVPLENSQKERIKKDSKSLHFDKIVSFLELVKTEPDYFKHDGLYIPDAGSDEQGFSITLLREIYNSHYRASLTAKSFNDLLSSDCIKGEVEIYKANNMKIRYSLPVS